MPARKIQQVIRARATSDGAGVRLKRSLGQTQDARLDPFLMLDEFASDNPDDYIAGFPPHPHRGFETVTYMLQGHMLHEDHLGNRGDLTSGGVQWMTAARGIIHSEMPQQAEGRMHGFQLWINLPAREKMKTPAYRDISAENIPVVRLNDCGQVKVIAGTLEIAGEATAGPIQGLTTEPIYFDVQLRPNAPFRHPLPKGHNAFVYVFTGKVTVGESGNDGPQVESAAALLGPGDEVVLHAGKEGARLLLLAGKPLRESVVQYGPFVMNTREEIDQAIRDYQAGTLAQAARPEQTPQR